MARRNSTSNKTSRRAAAAAALAVLALTSTTGAAAARVLRSENNPSFPMHSSYGSYHGVAPDMGPTGNLLRGPAVTPGRGGSSGSSANKGNTGSPPVRGSLAIIQGSLAQAEARREGSGFEGIEPENVVMSTAGNVRMSRVQTENMLPKGLMYTGTAQENVVGGRMAAIAATQNGARAQSISGGRPIASRYGATPQAASVRMMGGVPITTKYPVAVAGSGHVHIASISGAGDVTGVIASTPNVQSIAKAG
jgi:hypothetical protein